VGVCEGFCWFDGGGGADGCFYHGFWDGEGTFGGFVGLRILSGVERVCV